MARLRARFGFRSLCYPTNRREPAAWGNSSWTESAVRAFEEFHVSSTDAGGIREKLPPETLLDTDQPRLVRAGITCMYDVDTIRAYVAHENQHQRRGWVLRLLARRAATLRVG